jgi:hypothetical protein
MSGACQFMLTGARRLRPPDLARAPFRPARRHPRRYDLARRYCPFACLISCRILAKLEGVVVFFELLITALARARNMAIPISRVVLQIVLGGAIVEVTAILIYSHWRRLTRRVERTDWPA